jgi:transketolase
LFEGGDVSAVPRFELFDHDTYAVCGDGDLMEGVSAEAASVEPAST